MGRISETLNRSGLNLVEKYTGSSIMPKKIISLSVSSLPADLTPATTSVAEILQTLSNRNPEEALREIQQILTQSGVAGLSEKAGRTWENLPPGASTVEVYKGVDIDGHTFQIKVYFFNATESPQVVVPHVHEDVPANHLQAITFAATGTVKEGVFDIDPSNPNQVILRTSRDRDLHSIVSDSANGAIHNFELNDGKAAVVALYYAQKNPNKQYFTELIKTQERLNEILQQIEGGLQPYQPIPGFENHYKIDPSLLEQLGESEKARALQLLHTITIPGQKEIARPRQLDITQENVSAVIATLKSWGISDAELASPSFIDSIQPLLDKVKSGEIPFFTVAWKPLTSSCSHSAQFRPNPITHDVGVSLSNEFRTLLRFDELTNTIHAYFSPATFEAAPGEILKAGSTQFDSSKIGLSSLAINPYNFIKSLQRYDGPAYKVVFHIHNNFREDTSFISNNPGIRNAAVSVDTQAYVEGVQREIVTLIAGKKAWGIEVHFDSETSKHDFSRAREGKVVEVKVEKPIKEKTVEELQLEGKRQFAKLAQQQKKAEEQARKKAEWDAKRAAEAEKSFS